MVEIANVAIPASLPARLAGGLRVKPPRGVVLPKHDPALLLRTFSPHRRERGRLFSKTGGPAGIGVFRKGPPSLCLGSTLPGTSG